METEMEGNASFIGLEGESSGSNIVDEASPAQHWPEHTMPLDSLMQVLPECADPDIPECTKETLQDCMLELVAMVVHQAAHCCRRGQRRTIAPEDLHWAMESLGFGDYVVNDPDTPIADAEVEITSATARDEVCGAERKMPAFETEENVATNMQPQLQEQEAAMTA